jgi:hypothetical protein
MIEMLKNDCFNRFDCDDIVDLMELVNFVFEIREGRYIVTN